VENIFNYLLIKEVVAPDGIPLIGKSEPEVAFEFSASKFIYFTVSFICGI
jgi:hypothetical protein